MPAVDIDRMAPEQAQAWRRLWKVLLSPPETEETRNGGSLATDTATGKTADSEELTTDGNDAMDRSGKDG